MTKKKNQNIDQLQEQLKAKDESYKRALADYQNLQRQSGLQQQRASLQAKVEIIRSFLPIFDNLKRVLEHFEDDSLRLVVNEFQRQLQASGVEEIKIKLGKTEFNHLQMEAIDAGEGPDNIVLKVTEPGYILQNPAQSQSHNQSEAPIIRPAKVIVGRTKTIKN